MRRSRRRRELGEVGEQLVMGLGRDELGGRILGT